MITFKTCCFRLSLRTGAIIVAALEFILLIYSNYDEGWPISLVALTVNVVVLAFIGILIYGIVREKRSFLWLWVIIANTICGSLLALAILFTIVWIGLFFFRTSSYEGLSRHMHGLMYQRLSLYLYTVSIIQAIFSWIVYSYLYELSEREEEHKKESVAQTEMYNLV